MSDLSAVTGGSEESPASPGERWISFLRGYGPVNKVDGMYAETVRRQADAHGVTPLSFVHPVASRLEAALQPATCCLTNLVLTGTAGDGKTTLCGELWQRLTGDDSRVTGRDRRNYRSTEVDTPSGRRTIHFIFEFSGFTPEQGQQWPPEKLSLLDRLARSALDPDPREFFVVAANDGRLVQAFDAMPDGDARRLAPVFEQLLTTGRDAEPDVDLLFLNLSRMSTSDVLSLSLDCLLSRPEWRCLDDERHDPAFGEASPLSRNHRLLGDQAFRSRLQALAELCDANGFHVSIREVLLLLVNGLLGCREGDHVAQPQTLRDMVRDGRAHEGSIHDNILGANLPERRRERFAVFRFLAGFRIGLETTNALDAVLVFGPDDDELRDHHRRLLGDDPLYGDNTAFARLREEYLEAEESRIGSDAFLDALLSERRRLFFRISEDDERFDPWKLTVFQSTRAYRRQLLAPLKAGGEVDAGTMSSLVQGLNRIWTGMLAGSLDRLYLTTGLDFTAAKVSDIHLYDVPLRPSIHGDGVTIRYDAARFAPVLRVHLGRDHGADLTLSLTRFEFLMRVAQGALPSSFSKECYEDIVSFKTKVLAEFYRLNSGRSHHISVLTPGRDGAFTTRQLGISL